MKYPRLLLLSLLAAGCEKDIDIAYHASEPKYVIEAKLDRQTARMRVTLSQGMAGYDPNAGVAGVRATIQGNDGTSAAFTEQDNGWYTAWMQGRPGTLYRLDVEVDGQHFTSSSTMQDTPQMNSLRFVWKKVATERFLIADLHLQDMPGQTNYYFMHLYRNNLGYRWAVCTDRANPGGDLQQLFQCMRDGETGSSVLNEGDRLQFIIRAIDRPAYDYLYSMQQMENSMTNPIANFTGGCLGYFSAYSQITYNVIFSYADVEEE